MKRLFSIITVLALAVCMSATHAHALRNLNEGDPMPDFTLKDTSGADVTLSALKGKVVVAVFFRPGHESLQKTFQELQAIHEKYAEKGVVVLALTPDTDDLAAIASEVENAKVTFPVLLDEGRHVYGLWGVFLFPTTAIVCKEGTLIKEIPSHNRKYAETVEGYVRLELGEITAEELEATLNPVDKVDLTPEQKKADRHLLLADRMIERNRLDRAVGDLEEAVASDPENVKARVTFGFVLLKLEKAEEAKAHFEHAIEINPKAEDAAAGLGASLVALGELDKGIGVLEEALKLNPSPARTYYELGKAYMKKGEHEKAAASMMKSVEELGGALW